MRQTTAPQRETWHCERAPLDRESQGGGKAESGYEERGTGKAGETRRAVTNSESTGGSDSEGETLSDERPTDRKRWRLSP